MKRWLRTEDGWSVVVAFVILAVAGLGLLGWVPVVKEWTDPAKAVQPGWQNVLFAYLFLLGTLGVGTAVMGGNVRRFALGFTVLFLISYGGWVLGHYGMIAATPDKLGKLNLTWSLSLTGEAGYLLALAAGLVVGNLLPGVANWLREAARTEWYIKTAIVLVGASLGLKAAEESGRAQAVLFRGLAAIIEAYLIYWAVVYLVARKVFGFSREWAAPLASGISICGVSAAITTGAAIRARPVVPVMVSSLVVVFSVVELILLPIAARTFLGDQPMVAAAWMGLAVKTDGAAISSGAVTEAFILADAAAAGVNYEPGWMTMTTTTVKVFIDLFIGVWAVVLAVVWAYGIDRQPGRGVPFRDIWERFPKFVFGYVLTFAGLMVVGLYASPEVVKSLKSATESTDAFRRIFFAMTFFAIGCSSNVKRLWAEGLGRLAVVYAVSLFGFVIWFGFVHFVAVFPRRATAAEDGRLTWLRETPDRQTPRRRTNSANKRPSRCCRPSGGSWEAASGWGWCCSACSSCSVRPFRCRANAHLSRRRLADSRRECPSRHDRRRTARRRVAGPRCRGRLDGRRRPKFVQGGCQSGRVGHVDGHTAGTGHPPRDGVVVGDTRQTTRGGFDQGDRHHLEQAGQNEHVGRTVQVRHSHPWETDQEFHPVAEPASPLGDEGVGLCFPTPRRRRDRRSAP
jgi:uncharacterized membrane protein YadS